MVCADLDRRTARGRGLDARAAQTSLAWNRERGTIRGLHYQSPPFEEVKVVRPLRGTVFDVAVDLRPDSPTFLRWFGVQLDWQSQRMLYIPAGCAHGYQTLTDDALVSYVVSTRYMPSHQQGIRWDDPAVNVAWPLGPPTRISPRDAGFPNYEPSAVPVARSDGIATAVLGLVVAAERRILFLDRTPPPLVLLIPLDRAAPGLSSNDT